MDFTQRVTCIVSLLALKSSSNEGRLSNVEYEVDILKGKR